MLREKHTRKVCPDMLKTKYKLKTIKSLSKCGQDRWFIPEWFYHLYTPKGATMQALLKYDTLNEVKPRGTLFLLEPLSINVSVFAFVQKSLRSHSWLFSWGWDKTTYQPEKNHSLLMTCASLTKRVQFVDVWLFPWNFHSWEVNAKGSTNFLMVNKKWGWGEGGMCACSFSRTAAGNRAVPVCCDCVIGFWFIIHQCFLRRNVQEETCC